MNNLKIAFIIDEIEFKYFEFNKLITSFWLIKEINARGAQVFITTQKNIYLQNDKPAGVFHKTNLQKNHNGFVMTRQKQAEKICLNEFNMLFIRPDPPIDINYINMTQLLEFVDTKKTLIINNPAGIRKANEKTYINNFAQFTPDNIVTANPDLIKDFLNEYKEIVIKPLNKCFGKGVFYLTDTDKNIHSIIDSSTVQGSTPVMVQEYIHSPHGGDKRVTIINGHTLEEATTKKPGKSDFKFNQQSDEYFLKTPLTDIEREICTTISPGLVADGLYLVGLDFMDNKIIEVNVTSPCFFIKEQNALYNTNVEISIINYIEELYTGWLNKQHASCI